MVDGINFEGECCYRCWKVGGFDVQECLDVNSNLRKLLQLLDFFIITEIL
jgi:hypothetical protein